MKHELVSGNIKLRPLEPGDIELLYEWENNVAIWELSNTKTPFSKHVLAQFIKESAYDIYTTKQLRLIIENNNNKAVGAIDIFDFAPYHQRAGIGILIHNTEDRGKGYASDALNAVSGYAVNILGIHQLYANITSDNKTSLNLFEKAGFTICGKKLEWIRTPGGWKDELMLQKILK